MRVANNYGVILVSLVTLALTSCTADTDGGFATAETAIADDQTSGSASSNESANGNDSSEELTNTSDDEASNESTNGPEDVASQAELSTNPDANGVVDITFDDLKLPIDKDMVFRPFMMTDRALALEGKKVRISGYMLADAETRGIKEFILLKNLECKFGPGGQADHLINVNVEIEDGVVYRAEPVEVEGVLTINPFTGLDGNTWSIFDLACVKIGKFRPRR
ncbi:MAG: hypothetical protein KDB27_33875 [Planctomycetales bacterium]|nr:hypothetical protein [Planctomycetales bacterium]